MVATDSFNFKWLRTSPTTKQKHPCKACSIIVEDEENEIEMTQSISECKIYSDSYGSLKRLPVIRRKHVCNVLTKSTSIRVVEDNVNVKRTPQTETPQTETPQIGTLRTGTLQTGTLQTGTPQTETQRTETPQTGTPQTGTPQTGTPQTGTPRTETLQTGTLQTGTPQTGTPQTGTSSRKLSKLSRIFSIKLNDTCINDDDIIENSKSHENSKLTSDRRLSLPVIPQYDKSFLSPLKARNCDRMSQGSTKNQSLKPTFLRRSSADDKLTSEQLQKHLQDSVKQNDCKRVKSLLKRTLVHFSDSNNKGHSLLKDACSNGCTRCIKLLVKFGCSVNSSDEEQWTALHHAVHTQQIDIVKTLIACNANVNAQSLDGLSPLHLAVSLEHLYIVHELVKNGADPLINVHHQQPTPFQLAINLEKGLIMDYFVQLPLFLVE